jgi:hypothetical protein
VIEARDGTELLYATSTWDTLANYSSCSGTLRAEQSRTKQTFFRVGKYKVNKKKMLLD